MSIQDNTEDPKELAYLYDLFIVPAWREVFDALVDEEIKLPKDVEPRWRAIDVECGTGGYAISLGARLGPRAQVIGIDRMEERILLARGKADIQQMRQITFSCEEIEDEIQRPESCNLVMGDMSMRPAIDAPAFLDGLVRVAAPRAPVIVRMATRGSFDEFFSIYWEALYDAGLIDRAAEIESLINTRMTVEDAEEMARQAGLRKVRSVVHKEEFAFENAEAFLTSPLIQRFFLPGWLAILRNKKEIKEVTTHLTRIIDRERQDAEFDVTVRATLLIGEK